MVPTNHRPSICVASNFQISVEIFSTPYEIHVRNYQIKINKSDYRKEIERCNDVEHDSHSIDSISIWCFGFYIRKTTVTSKYTNYNGPPLISFIRSYQFLVKCAERNLFSIIYIEQLAIGTVCLRWFHIGVVR